jgi:MoaA/NifB/PqqE/SkfB family radical SAM enzyme
VRVQDPRRSLRLKAAQSLRRRLNGWLNTLQSRYLRNARLLGYPKHLYVDPTNVCTLRCPICPSGQRRLHRPKGCMDLQLYRKLLRELGPYVYTLTLTNWGEPLLHPHIAEMIRLAKGYGIYVGFGTNLQQLTPRLAEELITSGLDAIAVSIDGVDQETHQSYRVGGDLELTLRNLKLLLATRARLGSPTPAIRWQFLVTSKNEHQMDAARELAARIGVDEILFVPIYLDISGLFTRTPEERFARDREWLPRSEDLSYYDRRTGRLKIMPARCKWLWEMAVVNWDGGVSPCCAVIDRRDDFGSIAHSSFRRIWNNARFRQARALMARGKPAAEPLVCNTCHRHGIHIY